ncbi:hypothetical protein GCM10023185_43620 [Hymenobacter saemangeumensis]|uniref:Carboxypeptidase-like regulatory domain-containing protein n=1 Tax=Hymenobacter saemangeumensis TaxID=1084522 RepID=A0ABP8ISH3_9BACT
MNYLRILVLCCGWLVSFSAAQAQGRIKGVVQDSITNEPLSFASVFLANTTLGATTTESGTFDFAKVPPGTYELVGSYVGYRLAKQTITVGPTPLQVTLRLAPTGQQLGEVVVQPAPNKPEEYKKFTELFLGGTSFSAQCTISNPEAVRVLFDDTDNELSVRAKEYVQIDNDALGYRLKYFGLDFSHNEDDGSVAYVGQPVFEEMTSPDEAKRRKWAANRLTAYKGSFMHFLRSVYQNRLKEEGFLVQQVRVLYNPRYEQIEKQREALQKSRPDGAFTAAEQDSLDRWARAVPVTATLNTNALPIDSIRRVSADGRHTYLRFTGELQVAYFGEAPDPRYKRKMSPLGAPPRGTTYPANRQVSRLKLQGKEAEIQANGSLLNPLDVYNGEYWGFERIGEFLPVDYNPPASATVRPAAPARPAPPRR